MSVKHRHAGSLASKSCLTGIEEVPSKFTEAENALNSNPVNIDVLRDVAKSRHGLSTKKLRKEAWPKMLGINVYRVPHYTGLPLESHRDYKQVKLDVDRSGKRFPQGFSSEDMLKCQNQMLLIILRLLQENPHLYYYQGFHDIVLTLLVEVGERVTYAMMDVLVNHHLRDFMAKDMEKTKHLIAFLPALLTIVDPELEEFITRSSCSYYFTLSWLITWFGHDVEDHHTACRLVDLFLASHPTMSLYLAASLIIQRRNKVLSLSCEMSEVHSAFTHLPSDIDWEATIERALELIDTYPPHYVIRKSKLSFPESITYHCQGSILQRTTSLLPDHILKINPYADQPSLFLWPWRERRQLLKAIIIVSPILLSVCIWWLRFSPSKANLF